MVDAGWGAGKTAFMTMCHAYLKSQGRQVVAYNAWRAGYTQQPLFDLIACGRYPTPQPRYKSNGQISRQGVLRAIDLGRATVTRHDRTS